MSPCRNTHARRGRQVVRQVPKNKRVNLGSDGREGRIKLELRRRALPGRQSP